LKRIVRSIVLAITAMFVIAVPATASAATSIDLNELQAASPWELADIYENEVVNQMLSAASEQPVMWHNVANLAELKSAQQTVLNVQIVNVEFLQQLRQESLFAPAFELGIAARVYRGLMNHDVSTFDTVQNQAELACYGGAAVKLFSQLTGLSMQESDQHVIDEKLQASLDFATIGAAFVTGLTGGLDNSNCKGPFRP